VADSGPSVASRKASQPHPLRHIVQVLAGFYGRPEPPAVRDPFEQILWENLAYLASDERRAEAWKRFKKEVGTKPADVLAASRSTLMEIGRAGIVPAGSANKLVESATIAVEEFGGTLKPILKLPLKEARKALRKFPSIGEPGAEKILLLAGSHPVLGLDSNGLRPLLRLGFGKEDKNYSKTYRSVQEALAPGLSTDVAFLTEAHQLLRRHGQELCKTNHPRCEPCPLKKECAYYRAHSALS
jgi:endonuclease III